MKINRPPSLQPFPPEAEVVFKGVIFTVYQWPQTLFDGSVKTFERLSRPDVAVIIPITEKGKILLTKEQQPGTPLMNTLPAGFIESREAPLAAAQREFKEETGYVADEWIFWRAVQPIPKIDFVVYIFVARDCHLVGEQNLDAGERITVHPASFEDFLQVAAQDDFRIQEVTRFVLKALAFPEEMQKLKDLFFGTPPSDLAQMSSYE